MSINAEIESPQQAAIRAAIRAARERREAEIRARIRSLSDEDRRPAVAAEIARDLKAAAKARAIAEAAAGASRKAALARAGELEARVGSALQAQLDARWALAAAAETTRLARARGETVDEVAGRTRVSSRGGLQLAFERGQLAGGAVKPELLLAAGERYRDAFERASGLTTPARPIGVTPRTGKPSAGPQDAVFRAADRLARMRAGLSERQRAVLDRVCGMDMTVGATAQALKAGAPSVRNALRAGLRLAGEAVGAW